MRRWYDPVVASLNSLIRPICCCPLHNRISTKTMNRKASFGALKIPTTVITTTTQPAIKPASFRQTDGAAAALHQHLANSSPAAVSTAVNASNGQTMTTTTLRSGKYSNHQPTLHNQSQRMEGQSQQQIMDEEEEQAPVFTLVTTYLSYLILIIFGHIRDFFAKRFKKAEFRHYVQHNGYAPLISDFDSFYTRRLKWRIQDCFSRPITNVPGRTVTCLERTSDDYNKSFSLTGNTKTVLNLSSYNYLGFAQAEGPCADAVEATIKKFGISTSSPRSDVGSSEMHSEAEALVARFIGKEAAMVVSMGFATNSTIIPALVSKGCLVISDQLNHSSLVFGIRLSGASIKVCKHNDPKDLEETLRESIAQGQPRTHRPWKKILVIVEGLYSMEGDICRLKEIVALKRKYKFFLYVDEAHSIGALGPRGRGVCDLLDVSPADVDVLMGTFTKSFGAAGGYIAASKNIIDHLRRTAHSSLYAEAMTFPVLQQVMSSLKIIAGEDGTKDGEKRLKQLRFNAQYFSRKLRELGFIVYGSNSSPVIPLLLFNPAKISAFSRECFDRGIAVVVVGYPATPIISSRVRFCLSSAHCKKDLDWVLSRLSEIGDLLQLKYRKSLFGGTKHMPNSCEPLPEDPSANDAVENWWNGLDISTIDEKHM